MKNHSRIFFTIASVCAALMALSLLLSWNIHLTGGFAVSMFVCLSVACAGHEKLGSISYTLLIFGLVCLAMFFPKPLQRYGEFEFRTLIVPLLQIIMFSVGSQMSLKDFGEVVRTPKAVFVGLASTWMVMPVIGFVLAHSFPFSNEIAAGVLLMGCVPAGLASNVMCFLARANLALSVTLTACSTLMAPLLTPLLMKALAGQFVPIDFWDLMSHIIRIVIYPIMAGLMFNAIAYNTAGMRKTLIRQIAAFSGIILVVHLCLGFFGGSADLLKPQTLMKTALWVLIIPPVLGLIFKFALGGRKQWLDRVMAFFSMAGLCVILTVITAAGRDSLLTIGLWLLLACFIHNVGGYFVGYWFARFSRLDERSCRTVALEVGQQNGGLASGLALEMGKVATLGLAPAVFGALQNITGSALATWWRRVPVDDAPVPDTTRNSENK